jgi:thiaminase
MPTMDHLHDRIQPFVRSMTQHVLESDLPAEFKEYLEQDPNTLTLFLLMQTSAIYMKVDDHPPVMKMMIGHMASMAMSFAHYVEQIYGEQGLDRHMSDEQLEKKFELFGDAVRTECTLTAALLEAADSTTH